MSEPVATIRVLHIPASSSFADTLEKALDTCDERIELRTVATAEGGLELLGDSEIECVLVGDELPDNSGIELLKAVRERTPNLPVVLYTDDGSEEIASKAISAGVSEYLHTNVVDRTELVNRIESLVTHYRRGNEREHEHKRTVDLLAQTERATGVGGWELEAETHAVFWTDHLFELVGIEDDETPPLEEALDIYHDEDRQRVETALEAALNDGERFDIEVRFRRPDGEIRWLRVQGAPTTENEPVETLRGTVQDVTERHSHERVLREMYNIISDRDDSFDQQVDNLLELGRTELETQYGTLSKIDGDDYRFEFVAADDDTIQEGDVVPVSTTNCEVAARTEQTLVLGDIERDAPAGFNRVSVAEWGISCYLGAPIFIDDEVYGTFCFYDTEPRPDQFSEWETTLVDLMSRWISYELQRRQVTEQLHAQNEQLERFASIVSHDLRNPLGIIGGYVQIAVETGDVEPLDRVQAAINRMETLIDDMLLLSRTENAISDYSAVDLGSLATRCWDTVPTETATLSVTTDQVVEADETRLTQLLENLFRNSVEHGSTASRPNADDSIAQSSTSSQPEVDSAAEHDGHTVAVTVGSLADGFYIADSGSGIPDTDRQRVFESGYSSAQDGTGLGLSIVSEIVDAHGWEIEITTSETGGAQFDITGVDTID